MAYGAVGDAVETTGSIRWVGVAFLKNGTAGNSKQEFPTAPFLVWSVTGQEQFSDLNLLILS
jgi:hypothetical protein